MYFINLASNNSVRRGLEYCTQKKVHHRQKINNNEHEAQVDGSNKHPYAAHINLEHPRASICNCQHAKGRRIICKHQVALYFQIFPNEVRQLLLEAEKAEKELKKREKIERKKVSEYLQSLSKGELEQIVYELVYDGPPWQYERFLLERVGYMHD